MKIIELTPVIITVLSGVFTVLYKLNRQENRLRDRFGRIEENLRWIVIAIKTEAFRLDDTEIFLEENHKFKRKKHFNILEGK